MICAYVLLFFKYKKYNARRKQRRPSLGHLPWGRYTWMHSRAASPSMHSRSGLSQAPTRLCPLSLSPALPPLHRCIPGAASPAPPPQPLSLLCRPLSLSPALPPQPLSPAPPSRKARRVEEEAPFWIAGESVLLQVAADDWSRADLSCSPPVCYCCVWPVAARSPRRYAAPGIAL
jgi:hypothetical protein